MAASADIDYEVDRFLDRRVTADDAVEYFVRWKGFNSDWDSWEPVTSLQNCVRKINAFEKQLNKKTSSSQKHAQKLIHKSKMGKKDVKVLAVKGKIKKHVTKRAKHKKMDMKTVVEKVVGEKVSPVPKKLKTASKTVTATPGVSETVKGGEGSVSPLKGDVVSSPVSKLSSPSKKSPSKVVVDGALPQSKEKVKSAKKKVQLPLSNKENLKSPTVKQSGDGIKSKTKLSSPKSGEKTTQKSEGISIKPVAKVTASPSSSKGDKTQSKQKRKSDIGASDLNKVDSSITKTHNLPSSEKEISADGATTEPPVKKAKLAKNGDKSKDDAKKVKSLSGKASQSSGKASQSSGKASQSKISSPKGDKSPKKGQQDNKKASGKQKSILSVAPLMKSKDKKQKGIAKSSNGKTNGKKAVFKVSVIGLVGKRVSNSSDSDSGAKSNKGKSSKLTLSSPLINGKSLSVVNTSETDNVESFDDDDSDDDDILYFLPDSENDTSSSQDEETRSKSESSLEKSTVGAKVTKKSKSMSEGITKSKTKKIRLLDSLKHVERHAETSKVSVLPVRTVSPTPHYTAVRNTEGSGPQVAEVSQSQPRWILTDDDNLVPAGGDIHDNLVPASGDIQASLPISPASMSYKVLLENLPHQLHPKKSKKGGASGGGGDEEGEEDVERRISVRASECAFKYKEILIKKCQKYTQIWLNTHTHMKNALNPQVMQELCLALNAAKYDDSNLVMFSGLGNVFCSGIDLNYLTQGDKKIAARKMVDALRDLIRKFITFPKLIVAVVTGPAIGLGCALLPLCDIVYASDKATFYIPYAQLCQTPEGCASYTIPDCVGTAMANELLIGGRKITAIEACQLGLVSQVYWPTSMMQEVIPRVQHMALLSGKVLETTKLLMRSHQRTKLDLTNESECNLLLECWPSAECQRAIREYVGNEKNYIL